MRHGLKRKLANKKIRAPFFVEIFVLCISLLFFIEATQNCILLKKWNSGGVLEYQGTFTLSEKEYLRNSNYMFVLDNGDILSTPCEYVINNDFDIRDTDELIFGYSPYTNLIGDRMFPALYITSVDGSIVFLEDDFSKDVIKTKIIGCFLIGLMCFFVFGILELLYLLPSILKLKTKLKYYNKRKRKNKEHRGRLETTEKGRF